MKQQLSFTLIEILVVTTIIGLLAGIGAVSYSQFVKKSRDAKRKTDLEQIRGALEMYRSEKSYYPLGLPTLVPDYMNSIPTDPQDNQGYTYQYEKLPTGCDNSTIYCSDYTLGSLLETSTVPSCSPPLTGKCKDPTVCNYCLGPYGEK